MSQSPLARQSRKSLTAFSRAPSQLSRSTAVGDDTPPRGAAPTSTSTSPSSGSGSSPQRVPSRTDYGQNAFATPTTRRARHSTTGVVTPQRTPVTITYSPHMSEAAPPSRSSMTPFDAAANRRDALAAEAAAERKRRRASVMPEGERGEKKKRFVRTKPIWQRIVEWPSSVLDHALFVVPTSVEEMLPPVRFANPLALALCILQWLLLAPLRAPPREAVVQNGRGWDRYEEKGAAAPGRGGIMGSRTAFLFTLALVALSAFNAFWLFTRFRKYDLLLRSAQDPVPSPNASPAPAPRMKSTQTSTSDDEVEAQADATAVSKISPEKIIPYRWVRVSLGFLWMFTKWAARSLASAFGARAPGSSVGLRSNDRIQALRVWDPPEFSLAFFCAFAPSTPVISYFLTTPHPFLTPLILASNATLLSHLAAAYSQLLRDRQLLAAETMREYDQRFVYKRIFAHTVDRAVGTSDL